MTADLTHYWSEDKLEPRTGYMLVGEDGRFEVYRDDMLVTAEDFGPRLGDIVHVTIVGTLAQEKS